MKQVFDHEITKKDDENNEAVFTAKSPRAPRLRRQLRREFGKRCEESAVHRFSYRQSYVTTDAAESERFRNGSELKTRYSTIMGKMGYPLNSPVRVIG